MRWDPHPIAAAGGVATVRCMATDLRTAGEPVPTQLVPEPFPQTIAARRAIDAVLAAYAADDLDRYLAGFDEWLTVVIDSEQWTMRSLAEYEAYCHRRRDDGFAVVTCKTSDFGITSLGPAAAVASYVLSTHLVADPVPLREHQTLTLRARQRGWVIQHLHRSRYPQEWMHRAR